MTSFRSFFKVPEKIIRHMPKGERFVVLILTAVIFASLIRLILPALSDIPKTIGRSVYSEGIIGAPKLLNPVFADFNDADRDIVSLVFSGLLKYDPRKKNFVTDLAESIERSRDNLTYLVRLKKNGLWHDGKPVTADDVVFTFQKVIQDAGFKNPILKSAFANVAVQKIDEHSVTFTLQEPNSYFPSYLVIGLLPSHILKEAAIAQLEKHPVNRAPVGSGPYQMAGSFPAGGNSSLLLQKFEKFYGEPASFDFVRFSFFEKGEKLYAEKNKFTGIPKMSIDDDRFVILPYHLPEYHALFFNVERPAINQKKLRQALMKSIDKQALAGLLGNAIPIDTMAFRSLPEEWINQFDQKASLDILAQLGYKKGDDGLLKNSKGETLTVNFVAGHFPKNEQAEQKTSVAVDFIKNSWQALGINVLLSREEPKNFSELVRKREYDVLLTGQRLGYNNDTYAFWHSSQRGENGLNFSQLKSFRVDSLLEDLRLTFDTEKKRRKLSELEKLIADETPTLFLYTPEYRMALDKNIQGFFLENLAYASDRFANFSETHMIK